MRTAALKARLVGTSLQIDRRLKPEPKVLAFVAAHSLDELYVSAVTLAELRFGIELLREGSTRRDELNKWLMNTIRPMFDKRVLPITEDIMLRWRFVGRRPESWLHLFTAGPDYCRDRA